MPLRQLAGPFDIVDDKGQFPAAGPTHLFWWPGLGLIADVSPSSSDQPHQAVITLDGVFQYVSKFGWGLNDVFKYGWDYEHHTRVVSQNNTGDTYFDSHALMNIVWPDRKYPLTPGNFVDVPDGRRFYMTANNLTIRSYNRITGVDVLESQGTLGWLTAGSGNGYVSPGRTVSELFISNLSVAIEPECAFYDIPSGKIIGDRIWLGLVAQGVVYAPEWGIFISTHKLTTSQFQLRIWSAEVTPITLTTPAPVDPTEVKSGHVASYVVQALGSKGDVCPGEIIAWSKTGPGALLSTQSLTGSDGKAYTQIRYRVYDTDPTVLTASLLC